MTFNRCGIRTLVAVMLCLISAEPGAAQSSDGCTIRLREIISSGVPKGGIPALINPPMIPAGQADYLHDDDEVLGVRIGDDVRAYPIPILWWHEVINDQVGGREIVVSYCPLTGTAIGFDALVGNRRLIMEASGLIYNNNLVMYDQNTCTFWPQMCPTGINGPLAGPRLSEVPLVRTKWWMWKRLFPNTLVVTNQLPHDRDYTRYPYGDYRTNHGFLLYPLDPDDGRLFRKEWVLGIAAGDTAIAIALEDLRDDPIRSLRIDDTPVLVLHHSGSKMALAFSRQVEEQELTFIRDTTEATIPFHVMDRQTGSRWNILGEAVGGPMSGRQLSRVHGYQAFWFAWSAFFPGTEIVRARYRQPSSVSSPAAFRLGQSYPNPAFSGGHPGLHIPVSAATGGSFVLRIFDVLGRVVVVRTLGRLEPGDHQILWDGTSSDGGSVADGVYFYQISARGQRKTGKLVIAR